MKASTTSEDLPHWYVSPPPEQWVSPDVLALEGRDGEGASNACQFLPWVGRRYAAGVSLLGHPPSRLLLVGESHYKAYDHCAFTWDVVMRQWGQGSQAMDRGPRDFFPTVERLIGGPGEGATPLAIENFYQSVAFYNYVRESMSDGSTRPKSDHFKTAWPAFRRVLTALQPDLVLFFGMTMWGELPEEQDEWSKLSDLGTLAQCGNRDLNLWRIDAVDSRPHAFPVHHPTYINRTKNLEACSRQWVEAGLRAVRLQVTFR